MKIEDYLPEAKTPHPNWPKCHCFNEKTARDVVAEALKRNPLDGPVTDIALSYVMKRRAEMMGTMEALVAALYAASDALGFCRDARKYLAAHTILALCSKLNDNETQDLVVDFNSKSSLDARVYEARTTFEDLTDLASSLLDTTSAALRAGAKKD